MRCHTAVALGLLTSPWICGSVLADLITDPNDPRSWQGATVGTFALLYYGADTLETRQMVVDNQLLDDGVFDSSSSFAATLVANAWSTAPGAGGCLGTSSDLTGTGSYFYSCGLVDLFTAANSIDNLWFQTSGVVGETIFDLGLLAPKAAVFNTIDHGPLPQEAIESTVYLSNDMVAWTPAVVQRVWLEGFQSNLGILWDGFVYVVGTESGEEFRYVSIVHGGPGALIDDGDNEINGVLGVNGDGNPCGSLASFQNYGAGTAGTLGVPSLSLSGPPSLGSSFELLIGNSLGLPTHACLLIGSAPMAMPTIYGFELLVNPKRVRPVFLDTTGASLPMSLGTSITLCGTHHYLQLVHLDPAAPGSVAATQGLEIVIGQ